jgi:hypothetical protein
MHKSNLVHLSALVAVAIAIAAMDVRIGTAQSNILTWTDEAGDRDWNNARNWRSDDGQRRVPMAMDSVVIARGNAPRLSGRSTGRALKVYLARNVALWLTDGAVLEIGPGTSNFLGGVEIRGGAALVLDGPTNWSGERWRVGGPGVSGRTGGTIENYSVLTISTNERLWGDGVLFNRPGATIISTGNATINAPLDNDGTL